MLPKLKMVAPNYIPLKPGIYMYCAQRDLDQLNQKLNYSKVCNLLLGGSLWIGPVIERKGSAEIHTYLDTSSFFNTERNKIIKLRIVAYFSSRLFYPAIDRTFDLRTFIVAVNICKILERYDVIPREQEYLSHNLGKLGVELHALSRIFPVFRFWVSMHGRYTLHIIPMYDYLNYTEITFQNKQELKDWLALAIDQFEFKD